MAWMQRIFLDATLTAFLAFTPALAKAPKPPATAEQVVDRYVDAIGGQARIDTVQSVIFRGTYVEGDEHFDATLARMRPYYKLVGDPENRPKDFEGGFEEGYDGTAWEYYANLGFVIRTVGAASAAGRHETSILGSLIDWKGMGSTLTLLGIEPIAGAPAWHIRERMRDGFEQDYFIDTRTYLVVAERKVAPIHAFGQAVASETRFSDYRPVEGLLFPFKEEEVELGTNKVLNEFNRSSVAINPPLTPDMFSPPAFVRTPLQALAEQLYVLRDDPDSLMWSYFDFRRVNAAVDSDEMIRTIAYTILKTGQIESATRLLAANAQAYPNSSNAAFGLGRAYATAGKKAEAKAEFERALKLNPRNQRAADALKALDQT